MQLACCRVRASSRTAAAGGRYEKEKKRARESQGEDQWLEEASVLEERASAWAFSVSALFFLQTRTRDSERERS